MTEDQYSRQVRFPPIGAAGQKRIRAATVLVAGCGAVGTAIASHLARAGVRRLVLCDRDIVELTNLPRQTLFEREDALRGLPKAVAAAERLRRVNPDVAVEPHPVDLRPGNLESLARGADCLADGSDNFPLRFLLNDAALKLKVPWVYTGVISGSGHSLTIPASGRPCLRCYIRDLPPPGSVPTCATAGVIGPAAGFMAARAAAEILRILVGLPPANAGWLTVADVWNGTLRRVRVEADSNCPACGAGRYDFLEGRSSPVDTVLCGKESVQIAPAEGGLGCSLEELAEKLARAGAVEAGAYHLRFARPPLSLTVFRDGRIIVSGTADPAAARAFADKYI